MPFTIQVESIAVCQLLSLSVLLAGCALLLGLLRQEHRGTWTQHAIATAATRLRTRPWRPLDAGALLLAILLPTLLNGLHPSGAPPANESLAPVMIYYGLLLGGVLAAARHSGIGIGNMLGITRKTIGPATRTGLVLGLATLPLVLLIAWLTEWVLQALGISTPRQAVFNTLADPNLSVVRLVLLVFVAVAVAPLAEEAIFRGVFLPVALRYGGSLRALLVVNLLFALLHLHLPSFLPLLAIGLCLSIGMLATGSLLTSVIMHAIFNGEMLLLFYAWPALAA